MRYFLGYKSRQDNHMARGHTKDKTRRDETRINITRLNWQGNVMSDTFINAQKKDKTSDKAKTRQTKDNPNPHPHANSI